MLVKGLVHRARGERVRQQQATDPDVRIDTDLGNAYLRWYS